MIILRIAIAIVLIGHGIGHIMGFIDTWTNYQPFSDPAFNERPWILPGYVVIHSAIGKVFGIFWLLSMIGFFAAGFALVFNQSWWSAVAVVASFLSLVAVLPWWNSFTPGIMSKTSAVVVDIILLAALLGPWKYALLTRLGTG